MTLYKQKLNAVLYLLSSFKDSELKLKFKLEFELELKSELLLLLVLRSTGAGAYQTSVDHKEDAWIATDRWKHDAEQLLLCYSYDANHTCQLHNCFDQIEGPEAY